MDIVESDGSRARHSRLFDVKTFLDVRSSVDDLAFGSTICPTVNDVINK